MNLEVSKFSPEKQRWNVDLLSFFFCFRLNFKFPLDWLQWIQITCALINEQKAVWAVPLPANHVWRTTLDGERPWHTADLLLTACQPETLVCSGSCLDFSAAASRSSWRKLCLFLSPVERAQEVSSQPGYLHQVSLSFQTVGQLQVCWSYMNQLKPIYTFS